MDAYGDPHRVGRAGVDCDWPHRYASRHELAGLAGAGSLQARPARWRPLCVPWQERQADQDSWHDGLGTSLYAKRLERGRFLWPSSADGMVTITPAQLGYLLEGIDWRMPQQTWRPQAAG